MVPFSSDSSEHVRSLLRSLDGSNSDSVFRELCEFADGVEESILLLCTCFDHINVYATDLKNIHLDPAIVLLFRYLLAKPNFSTLFCQSVRSEAIKDGFLENLSDAFCLSVSEKIAMGRALLDSENAETQNYGKCFCVSQIEGLLANPSASGSTEQVQQIHEIARKVLQANSHSSSSSHFCDEMDKLIISLRDAALARNNGNTEPSSVTFADDVESEANSYFQRMFSEQLAISEMVEMLSRFKDSSDPREKSVFECVIDNLFDEHRFFPKYPEKQLGLAAVLLGSVINNQLVTHIPLGIALRYVLDALHKPADSKMLGFGTKALEQFINRLDEWPQYCNHILRISHLRGTHPELVAYIEGLLRSYGRSVPPVDHLGMSTCWK